MINFTVGPVQSSDDVRLLGAEQVPYFRTHDFSKLMLENEVLIKKFAKIDNGRAVFITGSGSAGMEASVINTLTTNDRVLVVNGGTFGERFVELLSLHKIAFEEIKLEPGKELKYEHLERYEQKGFSAFLINKHETSTGVHYNMNLVSEFCKRNNLFLIVDCVSSFLADPFNMELLGVDVMITGSQKALACPPGIAILVLSDNAVNRVNSTQCCCQYFDLRRALKDGERGQTPWTPAVGILRQINLRLKEIEKKGGVDEEVASVAKLANYFRQKIVTFPFEIFSESLSNAVTALHPLNQSAFEIFLKLEKEYGIWVCPNGGTLRDQVFRVGHIGSLTENDYDMLISAFSDLQNKHFI